MKSIAVFCGSRAGKNKKYLEGAVLLGKTLADQNITLIYGGSSVGLMGTIADTVLKSGGKAIGVIPKVLMNKEIAHQTVTELHVVESMHERKAMMYKLADGFIALPGGIGTLEELAEVLTWNVIGEHKKPCGLLNIDEYYKPFMGLLDHMVEQEFLHQELRDMIVLEEDPVALIKNLE